MLRFRSHEFDMRAAVTQVKQWSLAGMIAIKAIIARYHVKKLLRINSLANQLLAKIKLNPKFAKQNAMIVSVISRIFGAIIYLCKKF